MIKEFDNFIIESDIDLAYIDDITDYILNNEQHIFDFFLIKSMPQKYIIRIMGYELFKEYMLNHYGKIHNYMRGITDGKNTIIRILNIEDQRKYTTHKDATLEDSLKMILHEIVHICNATINNDSKELTWFREGLATNLSNQNYELKDLTNCDFKKLKADFIGFGKDNYSYSYTIVNYILNNYSKEEINKFLYNSDYLRDNSDKIFEEAKKNYIFNKNNEGK